MSIIRVSRSLIAHAFVSLSPIARVLLSSRSLPASQRTRRDVSTAPTVAGTPRLPG